MRALCARRLARSGLLPGLMRLAGGASVVLTSPPLRAAEVRITLAQAHERSIWQARENERYAASGRWPGPGGSERCCSTRAR